MKKKFGINRNQTLCLLWQKVLILLFIFPFHGCGKKVENKHSNKFVEKLISQMTIDEKIGQMTQLCLSTITLNGNKELILNDSLLREAILTYHIGSLISGTGNLSDWNDLVRKIQRMAMDESRLRIPVLIGIDHVHGANYINEATILPHNITLSCSFDTSAIHMAAQITRDETMPSGAYLNFAPVLDLAVNSYWPRFYETFGEDPLLTSMMGKVFIEEYQKRDPATGISLSSTAKHFIGYSDPKSGFDRTPAYIPPQILYEFHVPSFKTAVQAGVRAVMLNSGELNGYPVHASSHIVTEILRKNLNFQGVIISDIKDIDKLIDEHHFARNKKEAIKLALDAGIDMNMACTTFEFSHWIKELLNEGAIKEKRIDESVRRILQMKYEMGLFDNPYPVLSMDSSIFARHRNDAINLASKSIVLLKNKGILPIKKGCRLLVTGPAAHSKSWLNGGWTFEWLGAQEEKQPKGMLTLFDALGSEFGKQNVTWYPESELLHNKNIWLRKIAHFDAIILVLGEPPYSEFKGNISDLLLPEEQLTLVKKMASTKKPCIAILIEGRPRVISPYDSLMQAIIFAGLPGYGGGIALAEILSGKSNPSGKLSFSYPSSTGHIVTYNRKPTEKYLPAWPFGYGLSYSTFTYKELQISDSIVHADDTLYMSIAVSNSSKISGNETVLWFFQQEYGQTATRPEKKLFAFQKIFLKPAETVTVKTFLIPSQHLSYPNDKGNLVLEKGRFYVEIAGIKRPFYVQ